MDEPKWIRWIASPAGCVLAFMATDSIKGDIKIIAGILGCALFIGTAPLFLERVVSLLNAIRSRVTTRGAYPSMKDS